MITLIAAGLAAVALGVGSVVYGPSVLKRYKGRHHKVLLSAKVASAAVVDGEKVLRVPPIVFKLVSGSPTIAGVSPLGGVASSFDSAWVYTVVAGDSVGTIAARTTGESGRYVELLVSNPSVKTVGTPGVYDGPNAYAAAPDALAVGSVLNIPKAWAPYIDQLGNGRGSMVAWPTDTRKPSTSYGFVASASEATGAPAGMVPLWRDEKGQMVYGPAPTEAVVAPVAAASTTPASAVSVGCAACGDDAPKKRPPPKGKRRGFAS